MMTSRHLLASGLLILLPATALGQAPADSASRRLGEAVVVGNRLELQLLTPQMGVERLNAEKITEMPALMGEPDMVRALQILPGVSQGVEGFTGLYVRGGENDQNLFLYEGLPLYQVSHLGGVFSSFNVATLSRVDFYKGVFPAQYGGRASSIVDVRMKEPDFERWGGQMSVGLMSGNLYVSGPLRRNATALAIGVRRTWLDAVTAPTLAILNAVQHKKGKKTIGHYAFTDFNARLDHRFNTSTSALVMGYYGHDNLKLGTRNFESEADEYGSSQPQPSTRFFEEDVNRLSWGNWGVLAAVRHRRALSALQATVYYSDYASTYRQESEYQTDLDAPDTYGYNRSTTRNRIQDAGAGLDYSWALGQTYSLKAGAGYIHHTYLPEALTHASLSNADTISRQNPGCRVQTHEVYAYLGQEVSLGQWISASAGLRYVAQGERAATFSHNWEPRASVRLRLTEDYSLKVGYARMHQYVQQISNNYVNLPTDLWQPGGLRFKPLRSDQLTVGLYGRLPRNIYLTAEGWYKNMRHVLEYREGVSTLNPDLAWDEKLVEGRGWAYGMDLSLTGQFGRLEATAAYGLIWNRRRFDALNQGRSFPAKFDNRHKINLSAHYRFNDKLALNAMWTYLTGNRLTLALYNYPSIGTDFPDAPSADPPAYDEGAGLDYYSSRNNVRLPAYHRLDIGLTLNKTTRRGRKGTWNFGLYNAYCHLNVLTIRKQHASDGTSGWNRKFQTLSLLPILPSVSYTLDF